MVKFWARHADNLLMLLYGSLAICAGLAVLLVYRYDLYEKEPPAMLALALLLGMGAMWLIGHAESSTLSLLGTLRREPAVIAAVAASHEETIRFTAVLLMLLCFRRQFNDPMDGLIYGSIVGLGMAVEESRFFLALWRTPEGLLPATELVRLFGHMIMGGITCFGLGLWRTRTGPMYRWWTAGCIAVSAALHFAWDWIAFAAHRAGDGLIAHNVAVMAVMFAGMIIYGALVARASGWSRRLFAPSSRRRVWGWPLHRLSKRPKAEVGFEPTNT